MVETLMKSSVSPLWLSPIEEIIEQARSGRMFVLVDDASRENEGDLIIPADFADAAAINFMAKHGRGLICLALTRHRIEQLDLPLMTYVNRSPHRTAFTVSIEARQGVTTGISAADRARTVQVAIDASMGRSDLVVPGHVFPLMAQDGGVLVRAGHTEAAVDVARLAGLTPAGVICEVMNDDGTMARVPDLVSFARRHDIKVGAIADLIAHRLKTERLVRQTAEAPLTSRFGGAFNMLIFENTIGNGEHIALVRGDISGSEPVLVRMHQHHLLPDSLGDVMSASADPRRAHSMGELEASMRLIADRGRGVVVIIREPPTNLGKQVRERNTEPMSPRSSELRHYGVGAQILASLGVKNMILLSSTPHSIVGLEGYGIRIESQVPSIF